MFENIILISFYIVLWFPPFFIIYYVEKRNKINVEKKNIKYFVKKFFRVNFDMDGRINRYEFIIYGAWLFFGMLALFFFLAVILGIVGIELFDNPVFFMIGFLILGIGIIIHQFAVYIKRLHDLNKSGWNVLWSIIPLLGYLYLAIICFFFKGTEGSNDYGSDPNDKYQEKPNLLKNEKNKSNNTFSDIFSNNQNKIEKRLIELKQLLDDNVISKEEYEIQRKKIIGDV